MAKAALLRFGIRFLLLTLALLGALEAAHGTKLEALVVERAICQPSARFLGLLMPAEGVRCVNRSLVSQHVQLRIVRGCEGTETLLLLTAALLAYPASLKHRAVGVAVGAILSWILSVARLSFLFAALRYSASNWEAVHGTLASLLPVLVIGVYFLHWTSIGGPAKARANVS